MNFTREPIIETIITPKDGNKLVVRSSKYGNQEEYSVEAVEVVSFGQALFFRSLEKPTSFLVPVGDYEVVEVKETRIVLKNASFERTIKIGGGKEASIRKEVKGRPSEDEREEELDADSEEEMEEDTGDFDRKKNRRGNRRRRNPEERRDRPIEPNFSQKENVSSPEKLNVLPKEESIQNSAVVFSSLIAPPTTLISESIKRYKEKYGLEDLPHQRAILKKEEEPRSEEKKDESEDIDQGEPTTLNRTMINNLETEEFQTTSTHSSKISSWLTFLP